VNINKRGGEMQWLSRDFKSWGYSNRVDERRGRYQLLLNLMI